MDDAVDQLEKVTRDPMAGAAQGTATILAIAEPRGRGRFVECDVTLGLAAPGLAAATVRTEVVLDRRHLPPTGAVLPARISRSHPGVVEVDWDALAR